MSTTEQEVVDPVEVLESSVAPVVYVIPESVPEDADEDFPEQQIYTQKELSFFGKIDFFATMAKAIEQAMKEGVSISELLDMPDREEGADFDIEDFAEADAFVKAIMQLVGYSPELLLNLYCVILAVPRSERKETKEVFEVYVSDDQGFQIIETFIDQNWDVMVGFFKERITPLVTQVGGKVRASVPSKPSKHTRRTTPKESKS
jgi:hypothetical protein